MVFIRICLFFEQMVSISLLCHTFSIFIQYEPFNGFAPLCKTATTTKKKIIPIFNIRTLYISHRSDGVCNWSMNKHFGHLRLLRPDEHQQNGFLCSIWHWQHTQKAVQQLIAYAAIDWMQIIISLSIYCFQFGSFMNKTSCWQLFNFTCFIHTKKKQSFILIQTFKDFCFSMNISPSWISALVPFYGGLHTSNVHWAFVPFCFEVKSYFCTASVLYPYPNFLYH